MHFGKRLLCQQTDFDGADEFLLVTRRNLFRRDRIHPLQDAMQMPRLMRRDAGPQPFTQFFRTQRHIGKPFEQRAQVKPRAHGENRQPFSLAKIFEHCNGPLAITPRSGLFPRIQHIDQMMRHALPLFGRGLRRTNIKPAIKLRGIAGNDLAAQLPRKPHRQRRFSRSGWSRNGNQRRFGQRIHLGKSIGHARTIGTASTISASGTLPITWCRESFMGCLIGSVAAGCNNTCTAIRCKVP
jgi:hypothetical protein